MKPINTVDMDIKKIDPNFNTAVSIDHAGYEFFSPLDPRVRLYGVFHDGERYRRLPKDVAESTSLAVAALATNTSGGRVRFVTNSRRISISVKMDKIVRMAHMAYAGIHGFDLYSGTGHVRTFIPRTDIVGGYESEHVFPSSEERVLTLNMPLYNNVDELYIGIDEGATLSPAPDYKYELPVVYYGSSITQGGCASRPGNCYQAMISRELDCNFINLGFSGSGRGEITVANYIASLEMSAFVLDYDHNARSADHLKETHLPFLMAVREAHPELPIIMTSRPKCILNEDELRRREVIRESYLARLEAGDKNVYFIDGTTLMVPDGTVDLTHPTDLGFRAMADGILPVLRKVLEKSK